MADTREAWSRVLAEVSEGTLIGPDQLVEAFYPELKRLAATRMRRECVDHSWQPTVLVNELFLELTRVRDLRPVHPLNERERAAFFSLASQMMTRLLIHHTRPLKWQSEKVEVSENLLDAKPGADQLAAVEDLLVRLAALHPQLRSIVELKVFAGLLNEEIAEQLGCSIRTVQRQWQFARAWLESQIYKGPAPKPATSVE